MWVRLPITHLQIICRLLNKFLKVGDLEGVVFDFYMLGDFDVPPETAEVLDRSGRFVGPLSTDPDHHNFTVICLLQITVDTFFYVFHKIRMSRKRYRSWRLKLNPKFLFYNWRQFQYKPLRFWRNHEKNVVKFLSHDTNKLEKINKLKFCECK